MSAAGEIKGERAAEVTATPGTVGRGIVRGLQFQVEASLRLNACRFQVERRNSRGEELPPVPVEMRAMSFSGTVSNGDWVQIDQPWKPGEVLRPRRITNLTTRVPFERTYGIRNRLRAYPVLSAIAIVFAIVILGGLVFFFTQSGPGPISPPPDLHASVVLSPASAAPDGHVRVSGEGWQAGELVTFRYGPEVIGQAKADGRGRFNGVTLTVPANATGFFKTIDATGESSEVTREVPFTVTGETVQSSVEKRIREGIPPGR